MDARQIRTIPHLISPRNSDWWRWSVPLGRYLRPVTPTRALGQDERLPWRVYVPIGVFDDPGTFEPDVHDRVSRRIAWFDVRDNLLRQPRYEESSMPR